MRIGRSLLAVLLLFAIVLNGLNYWLLSASYSFNRHYITTVLCANKTHPELHCEGKCFMDIKLKELEQKNKHDQDQLKRSIESTAPVQLFRVITFPPPAREIWTDFYHEPTPRGALNSIFQPPKWA